MQGTGGLSDSARVLQLGIRDSYFSFVEDIGRCPSAFLGLDNFIEDAVDTCWDIC